MDQALAGRARDEAAGEAIAVFVPVARVGASPMAEGDQLWIAHYNGPGNGGDGTEAVGVSPDGSKVYVTGNVDGGTANPDYATAAYDAASGTMLWLSRYDGPHHLGDGAVALAVSPDGSRVFVTGSSSPTKATTDYATVAYDATSGSQFWASRYNGPGNSLDDPSAISVSPDGSKVFMTGSSIGRTSAEDFATLAYDAATGNQVWLSRYNGPANDDDTAYDLTVSADGSKVFVTGTSVGTAKGHDYATAAYDAETGGLVWATRYTSPSADWDVAVALAGSLDGSKLFVTGWSSGNGADYATVAYDQATGAQLWVSRFNGPVGASQDYPTAIAVSPDGSNVFVTGYCTGLTSWDYVTIAYASATGAQLWLRDYNGPGNSYDTPQAVAVSKDGSKLFVTGESIGLSESYEMATVAYAAANGARSWLRRFHGPAGSAAAYAVALSPDGSTVFVTGSTTGVGGPSNYADFATVAYAA